MVQRFNNVSNFMDVDMNTKIIVVDDSSTNRMILRSELDSKYQILMACSGDEALEIITKQTDIDLILLDIEMPGMNGYEVCRMLRKNESTMDIPIIFLTAMEKPEDIKSGFEVGGNDYVLKPFNSVELQARISNQLKVVDAQKTIGQNERLKTVGAIIASLNHEINNPLTVIRAHIELISRQDSSQKESLASIKEATERVTSILDKISNINMIGFKSYTSNGDTEIIDLLNKVECDKDS